MDEGGEGRGVKASGLAERLGLKVEASLGLNSDLRQLYCTH